MSDEEYNASEEFKLKLYDCIARDWSKIKEDGHQTVIEEWTDFVQRFRVPPQVEQAWRLIYDYISRTNQLEEESQLSKEANRITRRIRDFQEATSPSPSPTKSKLQYANHNEFLPGKLCTEMAVRFRTVPNDIISAALLALATEVVIGNHAKPLMTKEEYIDYIISEGGLEVIASRWKHPRIE